MSGQCKHVTAVLLLCARGNILEFPELSTTDVKCYWNKKSTSNKYAAVPFSEIDCFKKNPIKLKPLTDIQKASLFQRFITLLPNSALAKHRNGRLHKSLVAQPLEDKNVNQQQDWMVLIENCSKAHQIDQLPPPSFTHECCKSTYNNLFINNFNAIKIAEITKSDAEKWGIERQFRITGSRCYGIYTYNQDKWEDKTLKYFWPKSFQNKFTKHGKLYEGAARTMYSKENPDYKILETGLIVSSKQPWLGYSPDGVVYKNNIPIKLLEIKCPYSGKTEAAETFHRTCKYLQHTEDDVLTLKRKHQYYGQVQLGMALLNLPECDFVLYSSHSQSFIKVTVRYDEIFVKSMLETLHFKYFTHMLHIICRKDEYFSKK